MPPPYEEVVDDDQDHRRFSSQFTLTNSQESYHGHSPTNLSKNTSNVPSREPSPYRSFNDDMQQRFYATQKAVDEPPRPDPHFQSWQNYHYRDDVADNENDVCNCGDSISEQPSAATPLPPAGFFSPVLAKTRRDVFLNYFKILGILWVFALGVLSLYWGVLINVNENLEALQIAVVSFDGHFAPFEGTEPLVGNALIKAAEHANTLEHHLGWTIMTPAEFNDDPLEVRRWVNRLEGWGAIIVNNNATGLLRRAVETGDANYDPLGAAQIIYEQARDLETINQYVAPVLVQIGQQVVSDFGTTWAQQVLTNHSLSQSVYSKSPQALNPAIGFSVFNLRPFDPPAAIPSVTIGLIYLIIIAFFSFGFFLPVHMKFVVRGPADATPPLRFRDLVVWRWCATIFAYLCLSLAYSLVSRAFGVPFTRPPAANDVDVFRNPNAFGVTTFAVYWMINFVGMVALGLACENVGMVVGTPWVGLWLIFWVISNVATGFYALELAPTFFQWGHAWPLHSIVEASRTVLFDTQNMLGQDFGILLGWAALNSFLFPYCCKFMRWRAIQVAKKTAAAAAAATAAKRPGEQKA